MILPLTRPFRPPSLCLQAVEQTVAKCHPLLAGNRVAAFTIEGGRRTQLVVVAEVSRRLHRLWELDLSGGDNPLIDEVKDAIRGAVAERHRVHVDAVALVPRHTIPKNASGEVQYPVCRKAFVENRFERLDQALQSRL